MVRRRGRSRTRLDPTLAALICCAVALGTLPLHMGSRLVLLWLLMAGMGLALVAGERFSVSFDPRGWGEGAGIGLLFSLLLVLPVSDAFAELTPRLYPLGSDAAWLLALVLAEPFVEEGFFRGILQREWGVLLTVLGYGLEKLFLALPLISSQGNVVALFALFGLLLGALYGFVRERYGLVAALATHQVVNGVLFFLPAAFRYWGGG